MSTKHQIDTCHRTSVADNPLGPGAIISDRIMRDFVELITPKAECPEGISLVTGVICGKPIHFLMSTRGIAAFTQSIVKKNAI